MKHIKATSHQVPVAAIETVCLDCVERKEQKGKIEETAIRQCQKWGQCA